MAYNKWKTKHCRGNRMTDLEVTASQVAQW